MITIGKLDRIATFYDYILCIRRHMCYIVGVFDEIDNLIIEW